MNLVSKNITPYSQGIINEYAALRPIYISEGQFLNQFIWADFYDTKYITKDSYLFFLLTIHGQLRTMMPYCKQEDIESAFLEIKDYFNQELGIPLNMHLCDKNFIETMMQSERFTKEFTVEEDRDSFDYVYDVEKMKSLTGKDYSSKRNHLNSFLKEYKDRFEYRRLSCASTEEIKDFHLRWLDDRGIYDNPVSENSNFITCEEKGVFRIFKNCFLLDSKIGGVYVDGKLEAYSIGCYNPATKYAYIHIEKANPEIRGLYNYINQQFLIHEFPDAEFVNREDDLGQEGLRKAKMTYRPVYLAEKYIIRQR